MSALIGSLRVSLSADTAKFETGMKGAQRQAQTSSAAISKSMGIAKAGITGFVAALSVGLMTKVISNALDYASSLGEVAQQLGVTTRDLQVFRFAATQVGISQEEMDKGLQKLTKSMGDAQAGSQTMIRAFGAIGISVDDLRGKDAGEVMRMMADGLKKIPDAAQRASVETAILGRAGQKLDTLLAGGSAAINELSAAAERLGIVLSDEQIQNADDTADKLEAVKTVLAAQISGIVADNADSILSLASSLGTLTNSIIGFLNSNPTLALGILGALAGSRVGGLPGAVLGGAAGAYMGAGMVKGPSDRDAIDLINHNILAGERKLAGMKPGPARDAQQASVDRLKTRYAAATGYSPKSSATGGGVSQFLASGGGGGRKKTPRAPRADHSAEKAARDAFQFDQDLRRANMDVLRAQQDLATHYIDRNAIAIQLLDLEKQGYDAELDYKVKSGELSKAQADQLRLIYDQNNQLERDKVVQDEIAQAREDSARLDGVTLDLERDRLESQAQLTETAAEERDVRLRLLDLAYRQEKARLEAVEADEQAAPAAREEARRRLANLSQTYGNDRKAVLRDTRGPMEDYLASVPNSAAKMQEALERVKVDGIDALVDGLTDAATGVRSLGDVFKQVANQIIADLIRIQIQKMIVQALGMAMGGGMPMPNFGGSAPVNLGASTSTTLTNFTPMASLPGFATGGSFQILGNKGTDRNLLSLNGVPIARVSHGEPISIGNDNPRGGSAPVHIHVNGPMSDSQARRTGMQAAAAYNAEIARSAHKGIR